MSFMLQPYRHPSARASLATPLIFQKYANMPRNSLQGCPTAAFTKDGGDAYAGNGGSMGKFGFKMKKNPKKKPAPSIALQKGGRGWPRKRQPNQNDGLSLTTALPSPASAKTPSTDSQLPSTDTHLKYNATQPPSIVAEPTSTPR